MKLVSVLYADELTATIPDIDTASAVSLPRPL